MWDLFWDYFWIWIWEILIAFVTLNWGRIEEIGRELIDWWQWLWDELWIQIFNWVDWLQAQINGIQNLIWVGDYLVWELIERSVNGLWDIVNGLIENSVQWLGEQLALLQPWLSDLVDGAIAFAQNLIDDTIAWLLEQVDAAIAWALGAFDWIVEYKDLITVWLASVKDFIDWLYDAVSGPLSAFLTDPLNYVLQLLAGPLIDLLNWWLAFGEGLMDFVVADLAAWRNLWEMGKDIFLALADRPAETILELLAPVFLDWIEGLIAENW